MNITSPPQCACGRRGPGCNAWSLINRCFYRYLPHSAGKLSPVNAGFISADLSIPFIEKAIVYCDFTGYID